MRGMAPYDRESRPWAGEPALRQSCAQEEPMPASTTSFVRAADACSYEVVVWNAFADPYLRIAVTA